MEHDILKEENNKLKQATGTLFCPSCTDNPRHHQILKGFERLQAENQWMQQQVHHMIGILALL
jgi:hypothetical protein